MRRFVCGLNLVMLCLALPMANAEERHIDGTPVIVQEISSGFDTPWGMAFLPRCELLVTERDGHLIRIDKNGDKHAVMGLPNIISEGQGGLLDIEIARDFERSRELFLTYSTTLTDGSLGTALAMAKLSNDGNELLETRQIFAMKSESTGGRHFGSRVVEAMDGMLFLTIGDRGQRNESQNLGNHHGTIVRLHRDGRVPQDNPFQGVTGAQPEIWSYGHRNPQGAALDTKGQLWISEHGARGGDEINLIKPALNYGWPVISYGVHYDGRKIGVGVAKEGMEQPEYYWDPSIAPAGMAIYSGKLWPEWHNQFFVGSLKFDYISRLTVENGAQEVEQIQFPETVRVRDVREAPDGTLWFASEGQGAIYRISPHSIETSSRQNCF